MPAGMAAVSRQRRRIIEVVGHESALNPTQESDGRTHAARSAALDSRSNIVVGKIFGPMASGSL